jgi:hypothetical protein
MHDEEDGMSWLQAVLILFLAGLFFAMVVLAPKKAGAAETSLCAMAPSIQLMLEDKYGEELLVVWDEKDGTQRGLFVNLDTKSWTLVVVDENDYTCTMRSGTGFKTALDFGQAI